MKKFTFLVLLGTLSFSSVATAQQRFARTDAKSKKSQFVWSEANKSTANNKQLVMTRSEGKILMPLLETSYGYTEKGEWVESYTQAYK